MKILILGAGKMGSFFSDVLSFEHEVAIYDTDPQRLRFTFNTQRMTTMEEIEAFKPELLSMQQRSNTRSLLSNPYCRTFPNLVSYPT